jgi:hypothetical protein
MSDASRRSFLTVAGLGTAGAVAAATVGPAGAAAADAELPADAAGPMVAYIRDVRRGELALMIEGREVVITDKRLVARLAAAFARAGRR